MAHSCPDCGSICYCNGDIDDCLFDFDDDVAGCVHACPQSEDDDDPLDDYIEGYGE